MTHIEGIKLRLLHLPAGRLGGQKLEPPAEGNGEHTDDAEGDEPRGISPIAMWLKPPAIGYREGGLSFSYWNSLKFGGRYTGSGGISTTRGQTPEYQVGLNYNLIGVRNELDLFMPATALQEDSLGSYYYRVLNQKPLEENTELAERRLLVGGYTARGRIYRDPEGESRALDTPFAIGVEGGNALGSLLGARLQVVYEKAHDDDFGTETRWVITPALLHPRARVSLGMFRSWEEGEPTFAYDEVPEDRGYTVRCDLNYGLYELSYMNQYSTGRDDWVRYQWWLHRRFGIADAFVAFDEQYAQFSFGISVGADALYDKIVRRRVVSAESGSSGRM